LILRLPARRCASPCAAVARRRPSPRRVYTLLRAILDGMNEILQHRRVTRDPWRDRCAAGIGRLRARRGDAQQRWSSTGLNPRLNCSIA
jgi:hypothetical protein